MTKNSLVTSRLEEVEVSVVSFIYFFKDFVYLFMREREREREAETQAEGEVGSIQGARCGTRSRVTRIRPGLKVVLNR